jgi:hypothetical protein
MPDISDWQLPVAPTINLIGFTTRNNAAAFSIPIAATLLSQSTAVAVAIVFKPGTAVIQVGWFLQDVTLNAAITLNTVYNSSNPGLQVRPFPGFYIIENPGHDLEVEFTPIGGANLVADVYVYGVASLPILVPQIGLNGATEALAQAVVNVAAATTTTIVADPPAGMLNRYLLLGVNHITAAAAAARVSWLNGIGGNPFLTTIDPAVANFVWNNIVQLDSTHGIQLANGTSQPVQALVTFQTLPQ